MEVPTKFTAVLILLTAILYILMITFNALGGTGYSGLFNQSVSAVSEKYTVYITPAGWTFTIWSVIYIFLGAGVCYSISTLFRKRENSSIALYAQEAIGLNWGFYAALATNYAINTAWIFVWNAELITAATILLLFIAYTGWMAFFLASVRGYKTLSKAGTTIKRVDQVELRYQRLIVHNGIALYSTWTTIASLLNINISFQYAGKFDAETTSIVCVSVLIAILVIWFALENTYLDKYVRYTLAQYPVVVFATGGILSNQASKDSIPTSVHILTWIAFGVGIVELLARLVIVGLRYRSKPLFHVNAAEDQRITVK